MTDKHSVEELKLQCLDIARDCAMGSGSVMVVARAFYAWVTEGTSREPGYEVTIGGGEKK